MLTKEYLSRTLRKLLANPEKQLLEAQGLDAILEMLYNLRSVEFPVVILEGRSNGTIQLVEGPLDTFTQSIWVMGQFARGEDEADVYDEMYALGLQLLALLMKDAREEHTRELEAWDWSRTSYMKRYGGQNTRGWEFVLTFKEDFGLVR